MKEPADPCRDALQTYLDCDVAYFDRDAKKRQWKIAEDKARAALATPNPLPAMVEVLEELADFDATYDRGIMLERVIELAHQARAALAKYKTGEDK